MPMSVTRPREPQLVGPSFTDQMKSICHASWNLPQGAAVGHRVDPGGRADDAVVGAVLRVSQPITRIRLIASIASW